MTDAAILDLTDLDTSLDWEPTYVCEWGGWRRAGAWLSEPGCQLEASWSGTSTCCDLTRLYCDGHRAVRESASRDLAVMHRPCGVTGAPIVWTPLGGNRG